MVYRLAASVGPILLTALCVTLGDLIAGSVGAVVGGLAGVAVSAVWGSVIADWERVPQTRRRDRGPLSG